MNSLLCEHEWKYIEQRTDSAKELVCEENKIIDARPKFIDGRFDEASPWKQIKKKITHFVSSGGFEIEYKGVIVIVGEYDEATGEIGIEDVVNPDTGEVLTDEWFEKGHIYDQGLTQKIKEQRNEQAIDDFLNQL